MKPHTNPKTVLLILSSLLLGAVSACSDTSSVDGDPSKNQNNDDETGASDSDSSLGGSDTPSTEVDTDSSNNNKEPNTDENGTNSGNGEKEICDGIDNDLNGIIDDVDEGGDGICDCLNIGTIGYIGPYSTGGNIFEEWLQTRSSTPPVEIGDQPLTPELLSGLDVIVVLRADTSPLSRGNTPAIHEFSDSEVAALEAWVKGNGGLMTTIGYQPDETAEVVNVNRLLAPFGMGYEPETDAHDIDGYIEDFDENHPVNDGVSKLYASNGTAPIEGDGTAVIRRGNTVVLSVQEVGKGHVAVFGDEWITYDSQWQDDENLQVERFWLNLIKWLTAAEECQVIIPVV